MTFCMLVVALSFTAVGLLLLPWLIDRFLGAWLERHAKALCDQICRCEKILAFLWGFVLGGLVFCCRHDLWDWLFTEPCR